jgi:hypothetical protein
MLRINGTETASSRRADEEAGRYEIVVKNSSVRSINISVTKGYQKSVERLTVMST